MGLVTAINGVLIYSNAVGLNAINHGFRSNTLTNDAALVPFLASKPWWPPADLVAELENQTKLAGECRAEQTRVKVENQALSRDNWRLERQAADLQRQCPEPRQIISPEGNDASKEKPPTIPQRPLTPDKASSASSETLPSRLSSPVARIPEVAPLCEYWEYDGHAIIDLNVRLEPNGISSLLMRDKLLRLRCTGLIGNSECQVAMLSLGGRMSSSDMQVGAVPALTVKTTWPSTEVRLGDNKTLTIDWSVGKLAMMLHELNWPKGQTIRLTASCGAVSNDDSKRAFPHVQWGTPY
jgi:hypothetical protein